MPRPRLNDLLRQAVTSHSLTLISAPAGYGKTTLVSQWLSHFGLEIGDFRSNSNREGKIQNLNSEIQNPQVAWLALDGEDNDPSLFMGGLVAALQRLNPACGAGILSLLDSQATPDLEGWRLMGILINDILEILPEPFVLVLDDLHLVTEPAVYAALDYLLEHLPWQMHLLVTTRTDPPLSLARLRARGRLAELRLPHLRFTLEEMTHLLNERLGLNLSAAELQALEVNTEGWAAGLRLLAASLGHLAPAERERLITHLGGTHRHIFDFLAEEVLNQQEPAIRTFLLETAILDELTPNLCQAVTGHDDAALLLELLYHRNLFLVAVDDPAYDTLTTYRYHALFTAFLRQRLAQERPAEEIAALHQRAAAAETVPARAIDHYVAAGAWPEAAQVIEKIAETSFSQGLLNRLSGWILTLPAEIRETNPWLLYFLGVCAWGQGRFDQAQAFLEQALAGFTAAGDKRGRGETMIQLSIVYQTSGNFIPASDLVYQATTYPASTRSRTQLHMALAWLALSQSKLTEAQDNLEAALSLAEISGDPGALQILAMQLRSPFHCLPGGIGLMERLVHLIAQQTPDRLHPWRAALTGLEACLQLWRGDLSSALDAAEQAWSVSTTLGGLSWLMIDVAPLLVQLYSLRGDPGRADSAHRQFADLLNHYPAWRAMILFPYALHLWGQGRPDEAAQLYVQMHPHSQAYEWPMGPVLRPMLRGLLEISDRNYPGAEQTLRQALLAQQHVPVSTRFNARLLLAYLYHTWGRPEAALHELAPVLVEYRQKALPGFIIGHGSVITEPLLELALKHDLEPQFVSSLREELQEADTPRSLLIPDTGTVLTPREVEVLHLLVGGASNKMIAEELVVSLPTVKTHISRILDKLGVSSRNAAAARARDLRLV